MCKFCRRTTLVDQRQAAFANLEGRQYPMSAVWGGRSSGLTAKELDAEIEKISHERGLVNQGEDGISEAAPHHGVAAHLRDVLRRNSEGPGGLAAEESEDAVWERERERRARDRRG
jgi:hypothetical protein